MKSLDEIRNTSTYQNADDASKALIEQEYIKRFGNQGDSSISNRDRLAGQAQNLAQDVQNIQNPNYETVKDIPEALPQTQNIKADAAPNEAPAKSWDQIANTNVYKNASDEDKFAIRQEYEQRGGKAEAANPNTLREAGNFVAGATIGAADSMIKTLPAVSVIALEGLNRTDAVLNQMMGLDPNNSMLGNAAKSASNYLQNSMKTLDRESAIQTNAAGITTTAAGKTGVKIGPGLYQGTAIGLSGGTLAPLYSLQAAGEHYTNSEDKDLAKSLIVGGIQQLANEILPGSGGTIARSVESGISKVVSPVASPVVNRILTSSLPKVAGTAESASLGYAGGYGVGAGTALVEGKSLKEAHEQGLEEAKTGAAMGVGFHAATGAVKYISQPKTSASAPKAFNQKIEDQSAAIDSTLNGTGAERRAAFDNASERNTQAAHNILEEAGLKSTQQTIRAGGLGEAANVSEKAGNKAFADLQGVKQNYTDTVDTFKQSTQAANTRNIEDVVNVTKPKVVDEAKTTENKQANEAVSMWQRLTKQRMSEQNKQNINYDKLKDLAEREHDAFLNMPKDAQDFVKSNWESPFSSNTKGYDPIAHANEHIAADTYLDSVGNRIKGASDITDPTKLTKALKYVIPTGAHAAMFHHGGGVAGHAALAGAEAGFGSLYAYGKSKINQRRTASQREAQLQAGKEATASINRAQGGVKAAHEAPETPVTEEAYRQQRNQREQASIERQKLQRDTEKANEIKKAFAGHEDLQKQITPQNYTDKQHISNLRSELSQRTATAKAEEKATQRKAAEEADAKANADQVKEYKQANSHLKGFFSEATNNLKNNGKEITLTNFNKEVMRLAKTSKTTFKAGSKEEYYQDVKDQFAPDAAKNNQREAIDTYFNDRSKLTKDGTLKREEQIKLHRTLAEEARNGFGKDRSEEQSNVTDYWNKKTERTNKRGELEDLSAQHDLLTSTLQDAFKGSELSERKMNRFIKEKTQELKAKGLMNKADMQSYIDQVKGEAEALQKGEPVKQPKPASSKVVAEEAPAVWANKDFDQPVYVVKHIENGMSIVRRAEVDSTGKVTGYTTKESYVPTKELVKSKSTKAPETEQAPSPEAETTKLSDVENNNIRNKYMSEISDSVGSDKFKKVLDEFETFIEDHDLTDTATSKKYHNWVDTLAKVHERKAKGITDPEILLSSKEWADSTGQGLSLGGYLRHAVGKGGDWKPSLHSSERRAAEEDITSGRKAGRDKAEALKRTLEREKQAKAEKAKSLRKTPKAKKLNVSR